MRIPKQLEPLHDAGLIEEVLRPLMSGKEAAAWIVRSEGEVRCAKVYKEATNRSFKQRSAYQEGRKVRNSRQARAMAKGSRYGRRQEELEWQTTEVDALYKLAAAGVRVPAPHIFTDGVLLMELVLDHEGRPAPRLFDVPLQAQHARAMLQFLARQSAMMLCAGVVHGDLSEYNVLIAWDGPVIIDLPQAIDASANRNARDLFVRDLDHLTRFLARYAPDLSRTEYGREIWNLYEKGKLTPDSELTGVGPRRSTKRVDGRRLAQQVEEAAEAERPAEQKKKRRRRRRKGGSAGGAGQNSGSASGVRTTVVRRGGGPAGGGNGAQRGGGSPPSGGGSQSSGSGGGGRSRSRRGRGRGGQGRGGQGRGGQGRGGQGRGGGGQGRGGQGRGGGGD